jgi:glucose-6-phosphate 1-dehydrogenase
MSGPRADTLVLFGITGDLARKLVLPALYQLAARGEVTVPIVGVALSTWNDDELHQHIRDAVAAVGPIDEAVLAKLLARTSLVRGDYADAATFAELAQHVSGACFLAHYLAVPPSLFAIIAEGLTAAGLAGHARLVVEKPFGHDLASARDLNVRLHRCFPEERIFRVDHYLGKEPVQDLLVLRFANLLFEPIWNRYHVNSVQITMAETYDVADRGSFYDTVGTIRDVIQTTCCRSWPTWRWNRRPVPWPRPSAMRRSSSSQRSAPPIWPIWSGASTPAIWTPPACGPDRPPRPLPRCGCSSTTGVGPTSRSSSAPASVCP